MKILLLQSYLGRPEKPIFPLGLACLCACLDGHEVRVFDPNVASDPYGDMAGSLQRFQPEVVGISLRNIDTTQFRDPYLYLATLQPTLDLVARHAPKARRVIGGSGFSIYAAALMERFPDLDFGIYLEGERSFPALLADMDHPEAVPGVFYHKDGRVCLSSPPQLPDFDTLPAPRWEAFDLAPYKGLIDTIGVQAKRGCGLKCAYCTYAFLNGSAYRLRSPEKIVAEIIDLQDRLKADHFMFVDSTFNVPPSHAEAICRELIRRKVRLPWSAWYNERAFTRDFYRLAREAGCKHFSFSPDALCNRALKMLKKNIQVSDIYKVYELAKSQTGVNFGFNFFVNPPGQTYGDFLRLMLFWAQTKYHLRGKNYGFGLGNIRLEPDTEAYRLALELGVITSDVNLLPENEAELRRLFFTNPDTPLINVAFKFFDLLSRVKRRLAS